MAEDKTTEETQEEEQHFTPEQTEILLGHLNELYARTEFLKQQIEELQGGGTDKEESTIVGC